MPRFRESHLNRTGESLNRAIESAAFRLEQQFLEALKETLKRPEGFTKALKDLNRGQLPSETGDILEGIYERHPSGRYDVALQTDKGPLVLENAECKASSSTDPQLFVTDRRSSFLSVASCIASTAARQATADELLRQLSDAGSDPPSELLFAVELARFEPSQLEMLLPLLWKYILAHRDSNNQDDLVATGAAIRKYIAIIPMNRMGELAVLLETGHRSPLPIELEIEVAKMVFRNFEVHPPVAMDAEPELGERLFEIVKAYVNPRVLLRDKHSAIASLAIEALVAMRSSRAAEAWQAATQCPYRWFAELVNDDLSELHGTWSRKNPEAAAWLGELRSLVLAHA